MTPTSSPTTTPAVIGGYHVPNRRRRRIRGRHTCTHIFKDREREREDDGRNDDASEPGGGRIGHT